MGRRAQVDDDELEGPVVIGRTFASTRARGSAPIRSSPARRDLDGRHGERNVIAKRTYIGEGAELVDTLVGRNSYVQARARILERSALGDDVVGEGRPQPPR